MNVLFVYSGNKKSFSLEKDKAYVYDQIKALQKYKDIQVDHFVIEGKGTKGYFSNIKKLKNEINSKKYDLVHAHYSLSGLVALLVGFKPIIITYHGSDINKYKLNILSSITSLFAGHNIYVSKSLKKKAFIKSANSSIIPCGVDFDLFYPEPMNSSREKAKLDLNKDYILFASSFSNPIKNFTLAQKAISILNKPVEIVELKGKSRDEVRVLLNSVNVLLLTSKSEGSPQIIKEAMACNCPIVATDVGDIKEIVNGTKECFVTSFNAQDIAEKINIILKNQERTDGRKKINNFDNKLIIQKIFNIYVASIK